MPNRRVFYAITSIGFSPFGSTTYTPVKGAQQAGITTNFSLEKVGQLGQLSTYENVELVPEIEFTAEKCLDGYPLMMHLATQGTSAGTLIARSNLQTTIALNVFGDTQLSASGASIAEVIMSGMYWSASSFSFPSDGPFKESFTAVGNNKQWRDTAGGTAMLFSGFFVNNEQPFALTSGSGGIQRREDLIFYPVANGSPSQETGATLDENSQLVAFLTILPPDIPGISSSGTNDRDSTGQFGAHVTDITCGATLGRDSIYELGRKGPYFRFVNFPVDVTTEIGITVLKWDNVSALAEGLFTTGVNAGNNLLNRSIRIRTRDGTFINTGTKNKLTSVVYGGGDTGGSNVTAKFSYSTQNDFTVSHAKDPSNGANVPWPF